MENTAAIISPFIALVSGLVLWFLNEIGKRKTAIYLEKLKLYESLMGSVHSFYEGSNSKEARQSFNDNIRIAWIYASKEVIENADAFLETTRTGNTSSYEDREDALDALARAIRSDMKLPLPKAKFKTWISN
ncbi:MAG: hypothetical protein MRY32_09105 [Rickettsiales bacterium]|nr:hypothetical protein [Rickettsiales bacterium]